MANNAQRVSFVGTFDAGNILENLKKIKKEMIAGGMSETLFKRITDQMSEASSAISALEAKIKRGFFNEGELKDAEKQMREVYEQLNKISGKLENLNTKDNILKGLTGKAEKELEALEKSIDKKQKQIRTMLANFFAEGFKVSTAEATALAGTVKSEAELNNIIKERVALRQKELDLAEQQLQKATQTAAAGQIKNHNLNVTAFTGRGTKKGDLNAAVSFINEQIKNPDNDKATMRKILNASFFNQPENFALAEARKRYQAFNDDGTVKFAAGTKEAMKAFTEMLSSIIANATKTTRAQFNKLSAERIELADLGTIDKSGNFTPGAKAAAQVNKYNEKAKSMKEDEDKRNKAQETLSNADKEATKLQDNNTNALNRENIAINKSTQSLAEYIRRTREAIATNRNLYNTFDTLQFTIQRLFSTVAIFTKITHIIKQTFNEVKQLDKAFASIAMVTNYSVNDMWESYDKYAQLANELGQSTKDVVASSALFFQQGLKTNEVFELTEQTMKLATLAGTSFSESTSQMTAALRGFHMEMNEGARVTDVYSELAANAAADVKGIAYAMSKTSNIAASAGMEFETTAAFLAKTIESTQEAPSK